MNIIEVARLIEQSPERKFRRLVWPKEVFLSGVHCHDVGPAPDNKHDIYVRVGCYVIIQNEYTDTIKVSHCEGYELRCDSFTNEDYIEVTDEIDKLTAERKSDKFFRSRRFGRSPSWSVGSPRSGEIRKDYHV